MAIKSLLSIGWLPASPSRDVGLMSALRHAELSAWKISQFSLSLLANLLEILPDVWDISIRSILLSVLKTSEFQNRSINYCLALRVPKGLGDALQVHQIVRASDKAFRRPLRRRAQLIDNARQQVLSQDIKLRFNDDLQPLGFGMAGHDIGVTRHRSLSEASESRQSPGLHFGIGKMEHGAVILEHIHLQLAWSSLKAAHLLDAWDVVHTQALQLSLSQL